LSPDVSSDDIPQSVLEEVRVGIQAYFVPLLVISPKDPRHPVSPVGSGTLVELARRHYILTADHVWKETEGWEQIALVLAAEGGAPLAIPRDHIAPSPLGASTYPAEWGPDLALLEVPPNLVAAIRARKSFLNLALRRSMLSSHPPQMEKAVWAVIGLVGGSSTVELHDQTGVAIANLRAEAFFAWSCTEDLRDGYDYLSLTARTTLPGVPSSFKGVSGGGLWQIGLKMEKSTGAISWEGEHHFRGVAFWEEPRPPDRVAIRCHGPRSIFEKAWAEWRLPNEPAGP
jgi:hypothetical protein